MTLALGVFLLAPTFAQARPDAMPGMNLGAMCYLKQGDAEPKEFHLTDEERKSGPFKNYDPTENQNLAAKQSIASLTKLLTSHWAVMALGPEYRFKTTVYMIRAGEVGHCNLHIKGDMDPYMGREMMTRIFTQLKPALAKKGCLFVERFSYDENFQVYLNVFKHQTDQSLSWIDPAYIFNPKSNHEGISDFIKIRSGLDGNLDNVVPVKSSDFADYLRKTPATAWTVLSRPLHMMLRDINKFSFNYPPNVLFEKLGGREGYKKFIKARLKLDDETDLYNGSGYPMKINDEKKYNKVTCNAIVRVLNDMSLGLKNYKGTREFQLADIMATGGAGETYSTFRKLYMAGTFENTLVAKTGSADNTITFAGMLSTSEGELYFAVLTAPKDGKSNASRLNIRSLVEILSQRYELKKFDYTQAGDMLPFDTYSELVEEQIAIPRLADYRMR
ncbi:MAG: D-alanyl-D-alanine carboxypeptidase [Bdellovibrio sp.]|nr:D-alanyl-D-alanine carboxypeptidase [Bdellovibrio sp.]